MTDLDLARRAVACKHWKWQSGMEEVRRGRVMDVVTHDGETLARALVRDRSTAYMNGSVNLMWTAVTSSWSPDLTDPATVGCMLALVYEAYKGGIIPASANPQWFRDPESLVAALEAAP